MQNQRPSAVAAESRDRRSANRKPLHSCRVLLPSGAVKVSVGFTVEIAVGLAVEVAVRFAVRLVVGLGLPWRVVGPTIRLAMAVVGIWRVAVGCRWNFRRLPSHARPWNRTGLACTALPPHSPKRQIVYVPLPQCRTRAGRRPWFLPCLCVPMASDPRRNPTPTSPMAARSCRHTIPNYDASDLQQQQQHRQLRAKFCISDSHNMMPSICLLTTRSTRMYWR